DSGERAEFTARVQGALEDRVAAIAMRTGPSAASQELAREVIANAWLERDPASAIEDSARGLARPGIRLPGTNCVNALAVYMFNDDVRRQILETFRQIVEPLLLAGSVIDVIAHGWGTVVAYEGLRELESIAGVGRVRNFFTVGSALSILPVK